MKKLFLTALLVPVMAFAQSYPSPTFNMVTLQNPLTAANGGTGATTSTGTGSVVLSNSPTLTGAPTIPGYLTTGSAASNYAPIASPTFTGTATIPVNSVLTGTPTAGDATNKIANTFYVQNSLNGTQGAAFTTLSASTSATAPTLAAGANSTGVATTAFVAQHAPCPSILDNGGSNNGAADNTAAFAATAAVGGGTQACVYFPPGTYAFSGNVSYTLPNVNSVITILGAGPEQSILLWNGGGGLTLNIPGGKGNGVHVRDLSFYTGTANVGSGLFINNSAVSSTPVPSGISDVSNVTFHGKDGYGVTDYWQVAVNVFNITNVNFYGDSFYGGGGGGTITGYTNQGIGVQFTAASPPGEYQFNFDGCFFGYLAEGIVNGNNAQGITVANSNFVGGNIGILINATTGADQLFVTASQFNVGFDAIQDVNGTTDISLIGNYFLIPTPSSGANIAINLSKVGSATIQGNFFRLVAGGGANTLGIVIGNSTYAGAIISGNIFTQLSTGILLNAGSSWNSVQDNIYKSNTNSVTNNGSAACPPSASGNCVGTATP